jgi:hypothetical protein
MKLANIISHIIDILTEQPYSFGWISRIASPANPESGMILVKIRMKQKKLLWNFIDLTGFVFEQFS